MRAALFPALSLLVAAIAAPSPLDVLSSLLDQTLHRRVAPTLDLAKISVRGPALGASYTPTVLMHGLGDAGSNSGMQSLAQSVMQAYPGAYATAVNVANTLFSFIVPIRDQIDELAAAVKSDPKLASEKEVNMVGLSQGGLVIRGYAEVYGNRTGYPKVKNLVSICGVQSGVFNCPLELQIIPLLCDIFEADPYNFLFNGSIPLSFSDYFTTYWNQSMYEEQNHVLPVLNNQVKHANASLFKRNMEGVKTVVLSQATQDTVVYPFESEQFGGYAWAATKTSPTTLNFTEGYSFQGDLIGLKTRYEKDPASLVLSQFMGDHIRFSDQYWNVSPHSSPVFLPPPSPLAPI
jgi:palmitoyl-protein thioesterase